MSILQALKDKKREDVSNFLKLFILVNEYGQEILQDLLIFEISKRGEKKPVSGFFGSHKQTLLDLTLKKGESRTTLTTSDLKKIFKDRSIRMRCYRHMQQKCCCNFDVKDDIDLLIFDFDVSLMCCITLNCLPQLQKIKGHINQLRDCRNKLGHPAEVKTDPYSFISQWEIAAEAIIGISRHLGPWCALKATIKIKKFKSSDYVEISEVRKNLKLKDFWKGASLYV